MYISLKLKSLLQEGRTALYLAAENNHKEAVDILLDYTASANAETIVREFCVVRGTIKIIVYIISQGTLLVDYHK